MPCSVWFLSKVLQLCGSQCAWEGKMKKGLKNDPDSSIGQSSKSFISFPVVQFHMRVLLCWRDELRKGLGRETITLCMLIPGKLLQFVFTLIIAVIYCSNSGLSHDTPAPIHSTNIWCSWLPYTVLSHDSHEQFRQCNSVAIFMPPPSQLIGL